MTTLQRQADPAPRLLPSRPLPPYTYLLRWHPHPVRDPGGHLHGRREETHVSPDPEAWWHCDAYLYGFDLFNRGYYWEAHEAWEGPWHATGREGTVADLLRGLIRLAGAGFKTRQRLLPGRRRLAAGAALLFADVAAREGGADARLLGLRPAELGAFASAIAASDRLPPVPDDGTPAVVFATMLVPER